MPVFDPDEFKTYAEFPDSFVYRRFRANGDEIIPEMVIPGRTIRQALFSVPIERKLRSLNQDVCNASSCGSCQRCKWFGSTEQGGIVSVTDAVVGDAQKVVLSRIQLCEHSMQNNNLFSGEYLAGGSFSFEIIVDQSLADTSPSKLCEEIEWALKEMMKNENSPEGWYRLGATSTCTGQIEVTGFC
jgi:hypothetical protein